MSNYISCALSIVGAVVFLFVGAGIYKAGHDIGKKEAYAEVGMFFNGLMKNGSRKDDDEE